ncbi:MAG TPA: DUF2182 domain-containing protein [Zeimonas sp.]|nr:DUF2182 domain-containing protein [Zeimonas sp.]
MRSIPVHLPALPWRASFVVAAIALIGWGLLAWMAVDVDAPFARSTMPMSYRWTASNALSITAMWATMMAAMMLPSSLPMVGAFAKTAGEGATARTAAFVGAYLVTWAAFSLLAVAAQWMLQRSGLLDPMMLRASPWPAAALLLLAGLYQFTGLKRVCLAGCRSPVAFLVARWRPGITGAWAMGMRHGALCVGCCWSLMTLLFVVGVMKLPWVVALAVAVSFEKVLPGGEQLARVLGFVLIAAALASFLLHFAG